MLEREYDPENTGDRCAKRHRKRSVPADQSGFKQHYRLVRDSTDRCQRRSPELLVCGSSYGDSPGTGLYHSYRPVHGSRGPAGGRLLYEKTSSDHFPGLCGLERLYPVDIPSGPSRLRPVSSGEKADLCTDPDPQYF